MNEAAALGSVLMVDDEPALLTAYARSLELAGFAVTKVGDGRQAIELIGQQRFDAIISDIAMPELDGIEVLRRVRERDLDVPVILITGGASLETALQAVEHGALKYLQKPIDMSTLVSAVTQATRLCKMARLKREAVELLGDPSKGFGDRTSLEAAFKRALDGLWMAYQPIVQYSQKRIIAYEALLRSSEPALPHPGAIIDAAQRLDMLPTLGRTVRAHIAGTLTKMPIAQVFVNLHPSDLLDDDLFNKHAPLTKLASKVVLEITERASLDDIADVQARIAKLRQLGFRIAIDDVGAGYAGLTAIAQLEPEVMKIDMSLVRDVDVSATKQKLIGAMAGLCAEMSVMVIAEGIETKNERDAIKRLGCDVMQGYLFGRPEKPFPEATF
jgi:EAL domain-containing protein (putative c-di-GMP-specific phosphodiesterase class I)/CheY-like chemotaxis protein